MEEEPKFTIEEIRNYINSKDSLGDVAYFLNAKNIREANERAFRDRLEEEEQELSDEDRELC